MNDSKTILLKDNDDKKDIGVLTLYGSNREQVEKAICKVKSMYEGNWTVKDIIEELEVNGVSFSWSTDFEIIYC